MRILITGGSGFIASKILRYLSPKFEIEAPGREILNLLDQKNLKNYILNKNFDILIHTAIKGGKRMEQDSPETFYNNLMMFNNIWKYKDRFKKFINIGSGAAFDKRGDISCFYKEKLGNSIPVDYYGLSKFIIENRYDEKFFNIRVFGCFDEDEDDTRFIKRTVNNILDDKKCEIFNNIYMDFIHTKDLCRIIEYVITKRRIANDYNACYGKKYKLSDIAKIICDTLDVKDKIEIFEKDGNSYTGLYNLPDNFFQKNCFEKKLISTINILRKNKYLK